MRIKKTNNSCKASLNLSNKHLMAVNLSEQFDAEKQSTATTSITFSHSHRKCKPNNDGKKKTMHSFAIYSNKIGTVANLLCSCWWAERLFMVTAATDIFNVNKLNGLQTEMLFIYEMSEHYWADNMNIIIAAVRSGICHISRQDNVSHISAKFERNEAEFLIRLIV